MRSIKSLVLTGMGVLFLSSAVYAADLKVGGYANIWMPLTNNDGKNNELKTSAATEVDFVGTAGKTITRVDIDFPSSELEAKGISPQIEQAKVTQGLGASTSFTAGAFNTPIGYEKQDAPDKMGVTNGQLFFGRPANLAGLMGSWWNDSAKVDIFLANDWRGQATKATGYDNSYGANLGWKGGKVGLDLGYITSNREKGGTAPASNGNLLNLVLAADVMEHTGLAFEYQTDDNNDGWGLTVHHQHEAHGLTARYDSVENTPSKDKSTSLTVAVSCAMMEGVTTNVEWTKMDMGGTKGSSDQLVLQWVATF